MRDVVFPTYGIEGITEHFKTIASYMVKAIPAMKESGKNEELYYNLLFLKFSFHILKKQD